MYLLKSTEILTEIHTKGTDIVGTLFRKIQKSMEFEGRAMTRDVIKNYNDRDSHGNFVRVGNTADAVVK